MTPIDGLVLAVIAGCVASDAVIVALPAVLSVTARIFVPKIKAALFGNIALLSEEVITAVSVTFVTKFQNASTAFTVTLKALPAVCAFGVPVLPLPFPGA